MTNSSSQDYPNCGKRNELCRGFSSWIQLFGIVRDLLFIVHVSEHHFIFLSINQVNNEVIPLHD